MKMSPTIFGISKKFKTSRLNSRVKQLCLANVNLNYY